MQIQVACEPPLGFVTVTSKQTADFYATASTDQAGVLQLALWHDGGPSTSWQVLEMQQIYSKDGKDYFKASFTPSKSTVHFTLKIRSGREAEWRWLNDYAPKPDGTLILQNQHLPNSLEDVLEPRSSEWTVEQQHGPDTTCSTWTLTGNIAAASATQSSCTAFSAGLPKDIMRWFALVRHSVPWLGPRHGEHVFNPDKDALLVSFLRDDGLHVVLMAFNGSAHITTTIRGGNDDSIMVSARNDGQQPGQVVLLVSVAKSVEQAITANINIARTLLGQHKAGAVDSKRSTGPALERWYDAFAYCTWNGLGQKLSEDKLLDALAQLKDQGLDFSTLVIDDNWQSLDFKGSSNFEHKWSDFEANEDGFPQGLSRAIRRIREFHPGIEHIAVWHGIFGYWGGIDPHGNISKSYQTATVKTGSEEQYLAMNPMTIVQGGEAMRLYDDFYAFLARSGVDSVKADTQFYPDYLAEAVDRQATIYAYQDAWMAAVEKHFQHRGMACMAQTPQILFHSYLTPGLRPPHLLRNSDDFFPSEPTSQAWHIFCNAHNALFTKHLNVLPDWDMFQTAGQFATIHGVARCLSGGPLYVTDPPGEHDFDLIQSMTARGIDGRRIALRPESVAAAVEPYIMTHSDRAVRLGTTHQGVLLLGLLNVSDKAVHEIVTLSSFPGFDAAKSYLICSHFGKTMTGPLTADGQLPMVAVSLESRHAEILVAAPIQNVNAIQIAFLGLVGKFTGAAAVRSFIIEPYPNRGLVLQLMLKALGTVGIWLAGAEHYLQEDALTITVSVGQNRKEVTASQAGPDLLHVDVEEAVRSLGQSTAHKNVAVLTVQVDRLAAK